MLDRVAGLTMGASPTISRLGALPTEAAFSLDKKHLSAMIVATIKKNGGRFLQRRGSSSKNSEGDGCGVAFTEVDDAVAIQKTKQTFRHQLRIIQHAATVRGGDGNREIESTNKKGLSRQNKQYHPTSGSVSSNGDTSILDHQDDAHVFNPSWSLSALQRQEEVDAGNLHRLRMRMVVSNIDSLARSAIVNQDQYSNDALILALSLASTASSSFGQASLDSYIQAKLLVDDILAFSNVRQHFYTLPPLPHQQNALLELERLQKALSMSAVISQQNQEQKHP